MVDRSSTVSWRKLWWVVAVPIACWIAVIALYLVKFYGGLSDDQAVWGQLGDYVGGLLNPVISLVGLLAVIVTLRANAIAIDETRRQLRAQLFAESESQLTPPEFGYLMANFTAGGINVRALEDPETAPFAAGDYYRAMLESPHTRKAWPILRRMMAPSPYRQRIEATIRLVEEQEAAARRAPEAERGTAPDRRGM